MAQFDRKHMKRQIITILLAFLATIGVAQGQLVKLLRVDSASVAWRKNRPQSVFFDKEKARLLMSEGAAFGVECIPSFSPEWALTYDSIAQSLVYREAEENIHAKTFKAWYKSKKVLGKRHHSRWVQRKHPKGYEAPAVKSYAVALTPAHAEMLRTIWANAVGSAENGEVYILDGTKWEYFINGKRAKSHSEQNKLVKFTNELKELIRNGDATSINAAIDAEFQRVTSNM